MSSFGNNNGSRTRMGIKVLLHIYDLSPMNDSVLHSIGLGMYHTGIELMGIEYSFASVASIFESTTPTIVPNSKYRETILLGIYNGTQQDIYTIISDLRVSKYGPNDYNLIKRNCNHFTNDFAFKLLNKPIPSFINRLANVGDCCSCFIPQHLLSNAPINGGDGNNNNNNNNSFLVKAPAGRQLTSAASTSSTTTTSSSSFHGAGSRLGGTTTTGTTSSNKKNETASGVSLIQHLSALGSSLVVPLLASATSTAASTSTTSVTPPQSSSRQDDLTDRREKARKAALARLEMQQHQPMQR